MPGLIPYIQATDKMVGKGHATYADTLNVGLRAILTYSGLDPDASFAGFAKGVDGIPAVADAAARDALFPTPTVGQRVHRLDTKNIERWNGSAWIVTIAAGGTNLPVATSIANRAVLFPSPANDDRLFRRDAGTHERYDSTLGAWQTIVERPNEWVNPRQFDDISWYPTGGFTGIGIGRTEKVNGSGRNDIANHPEWIGKYNTNDTLDYVVLQEAIYAAFATSGAHLAARGKGLVKGGTSRQTQFTLTFDTGAAINNPALVTSLPVAGSGPTTDGPFHVGVKGAFFRVRAGAGAGYVATVDVNTANTITTNTADPIPTQWTFDTTSEWELVYFNGSGLNQKNKRLQIPPGTYLINDSLWLQYVSGGLFKGTGRFATQIKATGPDFPLIQCNGVSYTHFDAFTLDAGGNTSKRPLLSMAFGGPPVGGGNVASANQSCVFSNLYLRGRSSFSSPVTVPGIATLTVTSANSTSVTFSGSTSTVWGNEYSNMYLHGLTGQQAGRYKLVTGNNIVTAGALVLTIDRDWPKIAGNANGTPNVGDTFELRAVSSYGLIFGEGNIPGTVASTGAQGSEMKIDDCYFEGFYIAAMLAGNGNALQFNVHGGNIAQCPQYGIWGYWPSWNVQGVGFQAGNEQLTVFADSDPDNYGWDIRFDNSSGECNTVNMCRSESWRFVRGAQTGRTFVSACNNNGNASPNGEWQTTKNVNLGDIIQASGGGGKKDGRMWRLTGLSAGTSYTTSSNAADEPAWNGPYVGGATEVVSAGPSAGVTATYTELSSYYGNRGGSFLFAKGPNVSLYDCNIGFAQVSADGNVIRYCQFSRFDGIYKDAGISSQHEGFGLVEGCVVNNWQSGGPGGGGLNEGMVGNNIDARYLGGGAMLRRGAIAWVQGAGADGKALVGIGPADGGTGVTDAILALIGQKGGGGTGNARGFFSVEAPRIIGEWDDTTGPNNMGSTGLTNIAGGALRLLGGISTGNANGGPIEFHVVQPGASGTQRNMGASIVKAAQITYDKALTLFGALAVGTKLTVKVTTATVAAAGTDTFDASLGTVRRITANGSITVANPTNTPADGDVLVLDILNNTGGAITVTLGSAFLGTFPAGAAGKRRTQRYTYDGTATKWVPEGSQSGDL